MIRKGTIEDAEILSKVEATCFPPNEAATSKEIQERLNVGLTSNLVTLL